MHIFITELTKKDCGICGSDIIPYPLSTRPNCGEPLYYSFRCDADNGSVYYKAPNNDDYRVTNINREKRTFSIHMDEGQNCGNIDVMKSLLQLNQSQVFEITKCLSDAEDNISGPVFRNTSLQELEIRWKPPQEPVCNSSNNCNDLPNSNCEAIGKGTSRCFCNASFQWDPMNFACTSGIIYLYLYYLWGNNLS